MKGLAALIGALAVTTAASAGDVDPSLQAILEVTPADDEISVLVYLVDQVDIKVIAGQLDTARASRSMRTETMVRELRDLAAFSQADLVGTCDELVAAGTIGRATPYWIANCVRVDARPEHILELADRPDVASVFPNFEIEIIRPVEHDLGVGMTDPVTTGPGPEPGLAAIRVPEVWAMGYDGSGVLVGTLDTGVDGQHPALANRWAGVADPRYDGHPEWAFFDPVTGATEPIDGAQHGTHVMGTVCGGAPGDQIGVAPGAHWIHAAVIDRVGLTETIADAIAAMQWMIDPDGDPATSFDTPSVCANSWGLSDGHGIPACDETFWSFIDACEAAGIVMVFAAGNDHPKGGIRRPADRATDDFRTFAVGALDSNLLEMPVANFSAQGPTWCTSDGGEAIKPDISAPGVGVRSAIPGGLYTNFNGTSMATPHVAGVVALMFQANPDLAVPQVKEILRDTAIDLGAPGKDNQYGWGIIDAVLAVQAAEATVGVSFAFDEGQPVFIDPNGGDTVRITLGVTAGNVLPETATLYTSTGGAFEASPMIEVDTNVYDAVFPTAPCGATVSYYMTIETDDASMISSPFAAPNDVHTALAFTGSVLAFEDDFESDAGWQVENETLSDGAWDRGVPSGGGLRGDPTEDADGSGQCYVTDNVAGNSDVDGGPTRLISPLLDIADLPDPQVAYDRWIANDDDDGDAIVVEVSDGDTGAWVFVESASMVDGSWISSSFLVQDFIDPPPDSVRLRFSVADVPNNSVTEAAVDAIRVWSYLCELESMGDVDGDGDVDFGDLLMVIGSWGPCAVCPADLDGNGTVDFADILIVLANWT